MSRAGRWMGAGLIGAAVLVGCSSKPVRLAPVEDHSLQATKPALPGAENIGKPGYYTVKSGDTLIRIAMDQGQSWRDLVRWNQLDNPNLIEPGQVLRVAPPGQEATVVGRSPVTPPNGAVATPTPVAPTVSMPAATAAAKPASAPAASVAAKPASAPASSSVSSEAAEDGINFQWPVRGQVLAGFDETKNKGIDIAGKAGDPVFAAADGKVVYAGSGLRGYGNLLIIKHNNTFLTAYAHNQSLLVKEDQLIKRGQKIAEMGNSDADQVKLHFEIRRQGKPVDPAKYLAN